MTVVSGESTGTVEVTPSGIPIYYQSAPKRLYKIGGLVEHRDDLVESAQNTDDSFMWREVPSVTTVLDVLNKPALPYWGNKVGVDGILELVRMGELVVVDD